MVLHGALPAESSRVAGFPVPRAQRLCVAALGHADTGSGNATAFLPGQRRASHDLLRHPSQPPVSTHGKSWRPLPPQAPAPAPVSREPSRRLYTRALRQPPRALRPCAASPPTAPPAPRARPRRTACPVCLVRAKSPESQRAELRAQGRRRPCTPLREPWPGKDSRR